MNKKQKVEKYHTVSKKHYYYFNHLENMYQLKTAKMNVGRKIVCRMINYFQDYETCVKRGDKECTYVDGDERDDFGQQTEFFCGQEDDCT